MKIAFTTLGCKVNQYETAVLTDIFKAAGYTVVDSGLSADVYVVNSCAVTAQSGKKAEKLIRRLRREHPLSIIALTGCFPQAFPEETAAIKDVDVLTGTKNRHELLELINKAVNTRTRIIDIQSHTRNEEFEAMSATDYLDRTRASVKIEDGCDRYCSYCIIPKARGPVRSKNMDDIKSELITLSNSGYTEIVLSGINLSSYGKEHGYKNRLSDVVTMAQSIDGIKRIRLGSLEPELMTDEDLQKLRAADKFCPQFHLSLQSGCDETLKRMNRHYLTEDYRLLVKKIRELFDNPSITTDIMVGFPFESDEEFKKSLNFVKEIGFSRVHVFPYSPREGTPAAKLLQIDESLKANRARIMGLAAKELSNAFAQNQFEKQCEVLIEKFEDGYLHGYTKNYTKAYIMPETESPSLLEKEIVNVRIGKPFKDGCLSYIIH